MYVYVYVFIYKYMFYIFEVLLANYKCLGIYSFPGPAHVERAPRRVPTPKDSQTNPQEHPDP